MPRRLESFDFHAGARTGQRYDWAAWFDGSIWELERGVDFDCPPESMRQMVRQAATRRGVGVKTSVDGDRVVFQSLPEGEDGRRSPWG